MTFRLSHLFCLGTMLVSAGLAAGVRAQPRPAPRADTTVVLPTLTITATRTATATAEAPARVTVLDAHAMASVAARSVAEVLAARSGGFLRTYGPGGLATLSLRGAGAAQTLILLDGFRLADPQLGQLDLSLLPTILLESVEVMHGAASALYGGDGLGGVVHLRSAAPGEGLRAKGSLGAGAYGEREGGLVLSGGAGALSATAAFEYRTADGDFPYFNASLFPARAVRREGAATDHRTAYAKLGYAAGRHRLALAGWAATAERGLPGPATTTPKGERQWDTHRRLWAADQIRFAWGSLRLGGLVQWASLRYANPQLRLDETGRTRLATLEAEARVVASRHWLLGAGVTTGFNRARHPSLADDARETHLGAFAHATADYGRLHLFPALRLDAYRLPEGPNRTALSPRLGVNLQPLAWAGLRLKASVGSAFRAPTFNDRFWQPGGNPELRPERGWTFDGGVLVGHRTPRRAVEAEVTAFAHRVRDQIVWLPEGGVYAPRNLSRVRSVGLEASADARLALGRRAALDGGLHYTHTDARDRSDPDARAFGQPLRYVPRHQLKGYLGAGWRFVRLDLGARYIGRRYITTDGTQWLDPYVAAEGQLRLIGTVGPARTTLALALENALDRAYEGIKGYPMPPRTLRLRLVLDFQP